MMSFWAQKSSFAPWAMARTSQSSYSGASRSGVVPRHGEGVRGAAEVRDPPHADVAVGPGLAADPVHRVEAIGPVVGEPVPYPLGLVPTARVLDDHRVAARGPGGPERVRVETLVVGSTDQNGRQLLGGGAAVRPGGGAIDV